MVEDVLGKMPPDVGTLTRLERELAAGGERRWHARETLTAWRDWVIECWKASPDSLAEEIKDLLSSSKDASQKEELQNLTPTQVLECARLESQTYLQSALGILESGRSYQDKYRELKQLEDEISVKANEGDPIMLLVDPMVTVRNNYNIDLNYRARVQAVEAAWPYIVSWPRPGSCPKPFRRGYPKTPTQVKILNTR